MLETLGASNFSRIYIPQTGEYHCDWRLTIYNCVESESLMVIYIVNIIVSVALVVIASLLLHRRFVSNGYSLRDPSRPGFLRPRPIECFMVCMIIFHTGFIGVDLMMIHGAFTDSAASIEVIWELPWPAMFFAVTLYAIGIIGTTPQMQCVSPSSLWLPSQTIVDIFGTILLFGPSLVNIAIAFLSGYYIDKGEFSLGIIFIRVHYFLWAFWCFFLFLLIVHFGWRLTSIIDKHLVEFNHHCTGSIPTALKAGLVKLRIVLLEIALALVFFASGMTSYSFMRNQILSSKASSITFAAVWILIIPFFSFVGLLVIAVSPFEDNSSAARRSTSMRMSFATDNFSKAGMERDQPETTPPNAQRLSDSSSSSSMIDKLPNSVDDTERRGDA